MILTITMNPTVDRVYIIDNFIQGNIYRADNVSVTAGGKGINVAKVTKILGENVATGGLIGGDTGNYIKKSIKRLGIENCFVQIKDETRTCVNITDSIEDKSTEVLEIGPYVEEDEYLRFIDDFKSIIDKYSVIVISGSLPRGLPSNTYAELIDIANGFGKKVFFDSSGVSFREGIVSKPFMVKPNKDEIKEFLGVDSIKNNDLITQEDLVGALYKISDIGIELPVISLGKDGCITKIGEEIYKYDAPEVDVVNTVGSGDSFVAGCTVAVSRGENYKDAIRFGMACGVANTQFKETGMVSMELVNKFYDLVKVRCIDSGAKNLIAKRIE